MAASLSFGQLEANAGAGDKAPEPTSPFRIAILGDFSGRANRGETASSEGLNERKGRKIDRDNFDAVMARMDVQLELPVPGSKKKVSLKFESLDDFHPDKIWEQADPVQDADGDEEKSAMMNALLHHPDFQAVESTWLGLDWLFKRIYKGDSRIEVFLYDISMEELRADLTSTENLAETALHKILIEEATQGPKGEAWALLLGLYLFDVTAADVELLGRMAKIARQASVPFLADAHPRLLDGSFALDGEMKANWTALRQLPEANLLGLALPRFLLRVPYGERTKSIDRFSYEEFTGPKDNCHLWGHAALGCANLIGLAFNKEGWAFKPGVFRDLDTMHVHVYVDADDEEQVTVAETWLKRPVVEKLVALGLMPFLPVKGKDALQLFHYTALATPPEGKRASDLLGRWGQAGMVKLPRSAKPGFDTGVSVGMSTTAANPGGPALSEPKAKVHTRKDKDEDEDKEQAETPEEETSQDDSAGGGEEMDPELAAMMAELEAGTATEEPSAPAEEEMDPELAALMAELEGGGATAPAEDAPAETPAEEEMDPELAALLAELEGGGTEEGAPAAEPEPEPAGATTDEEPMDPELAALLASLDAGGSTEDTPATEEPTAEAPAEEMDPELAALLADLEGGASSDDTTAVAADAQGEVEALGGAAALEELGWPMFVPAFAEDYARQRSILQNLEKNAAVEKEVRDLVKKLGGYAALEAQGIGEDMGLNRQLEMLRELKKQKDQEKDLADPELQAMAKAYGANLRIAKTEEDKLKLLAQLKDFDKWANDPRNHDTVNALEGTKFAEKRQVQLEKQLEKLGGASAYQDWISEHPADERDGSPLEHQVEVLKRLREFKTLGGEAAYLQEAAGSSPQENSLQEKLNQLKAIRAAKSR